MGDVVLVLWNDSTWLIINLWFFSTLQDEGSNLYLLCDSILWLLLISPKGPKPGKSVPAKFVSDLRG